MRLTHIIVTAAIGLGGLLTSSCSKGHAMQPAAAAPAASAAAGGALSKVKDLGVIQLTNHYETQIDIGSGKSCTITPRLLDRRNLQLILSFGSKNAEGKPTGLCVTRVVAEPGRPFDVTVDKVDLTFTPKLATE